MSDKYLSRGLTGAGRREAEKALGAIRFVIVVIVIIVIIVVVILRMSFSP
jgi:hypothetical protein